MKRLKKLPKALWQISVYGLLGLFFITGFLRIGMLNYGERHTYPPEDVPSAPVALVLGAGLNRDGSPGLVLRDRVRKAVDLYFAGKVEKLLMSGDNSTKYYDEPSAMKAYAISLGVPSEDIVLDFAGRRTYDSCYRAREIFHLDEMIVVTQNYHLSRALYLCDSMGIQAVGVAADESIYPRRAYLIWRVREVLASVKAYWDVLISRPTPILGNPEPIFQ
jgi:SanA protein